MVSGDWTPRPHPRFGLSPQVMAHVHQLRPTRLSWKGSNIHHSSKNVLLCFAFLGKYAGFFFLSTFFN